MVAMISSRASRLPEAPPRTPLLSLVAHCLSQPSIIAITVIITINILTPSAPQAHDLRLKTATLRYPGKVNCQGREEAGGISQSGLAASKGD